MLLLLMLMMLNSYRIYLFISRPFTTKISAQKMALDLYTSHTQRKKFDFEALKMRIDLYMSLTYTRVNTV